MKTSRALAFLVAAIPAVALAKGPPPPQNNPGLANYADDHLSFAYPKALRSITVSDDRSKAECKSEDGKSKLTIDAIPRPLEGGVVGVLEKRLPGGGGVDGDWGEWKCREGNIDGGAARQVICGRKMKDDAEAIIIASLKAPVKAFAKMNARKMLRDILRTLVGFKAEGAEQ